MFTDGSPGLYTFNTPEGGALSRGGVREAPNEENEKKKGTEKPDEAVLLL